jgi:glucosylceramidase
MRDFVRDYLGPTFAELGVEADIWFGTVSAPEDAEHVTTAMSDMATRQLIKGIGAQWNLVENVGGWVSQYGVPVMQTEHKCGNYPWEDGFNPDRPPNDHAYAIESWGLIKQWVEAGVNSYSAWNMVLDTQGQNLDVERPWPQNALLVVDRGAATLTVTPAYYVFRHLAYFVDPGAVRIGTSGGDALAFKNPDGSIIVIVYSSAGGATTVAVGGTTVQFTVPANGWATVNWE